MTSMRALWVLALSLGSVQAFAQCYTVFDRNDTVIYQGRASPVDMSKPLHETVPGMFPGGHLMFDNVTQNCGELRSAAAADDTRRMGAAPAPRRPQVITELKNPPLRVSRDANGQLVFESLDD
ncbi:MAG TPA: hypothetical protein VLJ86_06590 [Ramlibacter sp.]|nr:hypothetical protein [Ramlibacter sp.]